MNMWPALIGGLAMLWLGRGTPGASTVRTIPYEDARAIIDAVREDLLPSDLRATRPPEREALWPRWITHRDRAIRERLERGDRDSVVNLLIFGSTFTSQPRPSGEDFAALEEQPRRVSTLLTARLDDLVRAVATPGSNERLQIARAHLARAGIDPTTPEGRSRARAYLMESLTQGPTELTTYAQAVTAASGQGGAGPPHAGSAFRDRGLSSDTSIVVNAALDQALATIKAGGNAYGTDSAPPIRRVGIVGPGLDFTDKHDGHDFYPLQTIQPFAVMESLVRHGLARMDDLRVTTLDLSPRVVDHIGAARRRAEQHTEAASGRAATGEGYVLNLPRNMDLPWGRDLAAYWDGFGTRIGDRIVGAKVPPAVGNVRVRSVRVKPEIVRAIEPRDVNIVAQRLDLPASERFDVIVATDVLVYYDVFEQSLALANISSMLKPGGLLVTNSQLFELPAIPMEAVGSLDVVHMTMPIIGDVRDRVTWYRRR